MTDVPFKLLMTAAAFAEWGLFAFSLFASRKGSIVAYGMFSWLLLIYRSLLLYQSKSLSCPCFGIFIGKLRDFQSVVSVGSAIFLIGFTAFSVFYLASLRQANLKAHLSS
jgi:hypothetical protein